MTSNFLLNGYFLLYNQGYVSLTACKTFQQVCLTGLVDCLTNFSFCLTDLNFP